MLHLKNLNLKFAISEEFTKVMKTQTILSTQFPHHKGSFFTVQITGHGKVRVDIVNLRELNFKLKRDMWENQITGVAVQKKKQFKTLLDIKQAMVQ